MDGFVALAKLEAEFERDNEAEAGSTYLHLMIPMISGVQQDRGFPPFEVPFGHFGFFGISSQCLKCQTDPNFIHVENRLSQRAVGMGQGEWARVTNINFISGTDSHTA